MTRNDRAMLAGACAVAMVITLGPLSLMWVDGWVGAAGPGNGAAALSAAVVVGILALFGWQCCFRLVDWLLEKYFDES